MNSSKQGISNHIVSLTADVVSAYVANNAVPASQLTELLVSVHAGLSSLDSQPKTGQGERPEPRVPIKKTITPDYLISLEDGQPYRTLRRHLTGRGLTPAQYREKWGLPADYPMVAPNYAKRRSELAKAAGLGLKGRKKASNALGLEAGHTRGSQRSKGA